MEREEFEGLLAREADGELTPEELTSLKAEVDSDPESRELAASWRETDRALEDFTSALGGPSEEARGRVLAGETVPGTVCRNSPTGALHKRFLAPFPPSRPEPVERPPRDWRVVLAAAAGLVLALGTGFGIGAAVFARSGSASAPESAATDLHTLREALRETRTLLPAQVRWTALCGGRLSLGTSPVPVRSAGVFHFATFFVERSDRPRPMVCQMAVLDGEEAVVEWESDGHWSIGCIPVAEGRALRLSTQVSFRPEGSARGVTLAAEPTISGGERVPLVSSRVGGVRFTVHVVVERGSRSGDREGTTL